MASSGVVISAGNRGPWINIVTWILGVIMCLASFIKVLSKRVRSHTTQQDDLYVIAATVCSPSGSASYLELQPLTPPIDFGDWL